jgi:hypothetical protein
MADIIQISSFLKTNCNVASDYLTFCRNELVREDYEDLLIAILDHDHYETLDEDMQDIVDTYWSIK